MSTKTNISWTNSTFNPWWGCTHVHEGCRHCYAETWANRFGVKWGPSGVRRLSSDSVWQQPLTWNRAAEKAGVRTKVFCASMADVFEAWNGRLVDKNGWTIHRGAPWHIDRTLVPIKDVHIGHSVATMDDVRTMLYRERIDQTPWLDWQILTKRPENILKMTPTRVYDVQEADPIEQQKYRKNVWLGTSISDQESADKQIPELLNCRGLAPILFLSIEPLLGPIDLHAVFDRWCNSFSGTMVATVPRIKDYINWVIVGGESGDGARPMHPGWVRSIRDLCVDHGIPFFYKQWGEWVPRHTKAANSVPVLPMMDKGRHGIFDDKGVWRENEGQFSRYDNLLGQDMFRVGKKHAGRELDGKTWSQFPTVKVV